jgi:hypothetical protein
MRLDLGRAETVTARQEFGHVSCKEETPGQLLMR